MKLAALQQEFTEYIRGQSEHHGLPVFGDGMRIYRNNYYAQLKGALRESYPHLNLWLGDSEFERAADAYIGRSPPDSWTLDDYGSGFPASLRTLFPDDPEVPELAWLELAMAQAFVAADADPVDIGDLDDLDWDNARITFVPSLRFAQASSNAAEIWNALEEQSLPPPATLLPERHAYLVWRRALAPCFRVIPIAEFQAISALHLRFSFADTCEILRLRLDEVQAIAAAGEMLGRWLSDGLIAKVEANSACPCS